MPPVRSRHELLDEIDTEYQALSKLTNRIPPGDWTSSRVNSDGWSLKDVLAHIAAWAERCESNCALGRKGSGMAPPLPGFKWNETLQANHAIYLKRRGHSLARVLADFQAGHDALVRQARTMIVSDLLEIGKFAWCGPTWSVAKHIRANTAAHYRWASKHFKRWLRQAPMVSASKSSGRRRK